MDSSPAGLATEKLIKINNWDVSAYRSVDGGGTGQEFTANLKIEGDSPGNKWYDCNSGETWIQADFWEPKQVQLIEIKSGNDCQERDPYCISLQYKYNRDDEFMTYNTINQIIFPQRYQWKEFRVNFIEQVIAIRLLIHKNKSYNDSGSWGSGTQLCELVFKEYSS